MAYIKVPQIQRAIGQFNIFLAITGFCFLNEKTWRVYAVLAATYVTFLLVVLGYTMYYLIVVLGDLDYFYVVFHHSLLIMADLVAIVVAYYKRKSVWRIISDVSYSFDYESPMVTKFLNEHQEKNGRTMEKILKYIVLADVYMHTNVMLWGIVEKLVGTADFILIFPCWFPVDISYLPYHIIAYLWEHTVLQFLGFLVFGALGFTFISYSHLTSQLDLLKFSIENLEERAHELALATENDKKWISEEANENIRFQITYEKCCVYVTNQCAKHHQYIIDYYVEVKELSKIVYFIVFSTSLAVFTVAGLAMISDNFAVKVKFVGVCILQVTVLFVFCYLPEKVAEQGENISFVIYSMKWYNMPKSCQKSLILMAERSQKPLTFTTLTGQSVNAENYMVIVKASYSYFNMLLASQKN